MFQLVTFYSIILINAYIVAWLEVILRGNIGANANFTIFITLL